jgi:hypothetical protein
MNLKKIIPVFFCLILSFAIKPDEKSNILLVNKKLKKIQLFLNLKKKWNLKWALTENNQNPKEQREFII